MALDILSIFRGFKKISSFVVLIFFDNCIAIQYFTVSQRRNAEAKLNAYPHETSIMITID